MGHLDRQETTIGSTLQALREAIWSRRPILGEIMRKHGDRQLFAYAKDFMDVNQASKLDPYKPEFIDVTCELIGRRLGDDIAAKAKRQLQKFALVSTADHHSTIDHPFWVNANIISTLPFLDKPDPDVFSLIVLSFASVSLNNASGFPRGILFHGGMGSSGNLIRLPLLPDKIKMEIVYGARAFTRDDLSRAANALREKVGSGELLAERAQQIREMLEEHFGAADVLAAPDLSTQITKINYRIWPLFFHPVKDGGPARGRVLDMLYVDIETLVTELLHRRHLREETLLHRLLFHEDFRTLALRHFDGIPGAFSLASGWGTYMFWGIDAHRHRVRMEYDAAKNMLVSKNCPELDISFTPEGIRTALLQKKIYPSMLLCYLTVSLYYGMKCLGGFCQVHDLTVTKVAWGNLLREIGDDDEADALAPIQTKELGGDGMVLAYKRTGNGELFPATGIDMLLGEWDTTMEKYLERSKNVTLMEMMNPMLPEMYTVLYPHTERDPRFMALTPEQILRETGLHEKLLAEAQNVGAAK